jgi:fructose-1,6-bisphosphatase/inositol monophosphatase family enzyme
MTPTPAELLDAFAEAAIAADAAVRRLSHEQKHARTGRAGQYGLDLVADVAALKILKQLGVAIVSEESGHSGAEQSSITIVLDPIDGSTNCAHGLSYYATSIAAVDAEGVLCGCVINHASGAQYRAVRGEGATRDGEALATSGVTAVEDAIVALSGMPSRLLPWRQFRAMGCASLALCDVAAGGFDGYVDGGSWHAPWDYLGGLIVCRESGAAIVDARDQPLDTSDPTARRALLAAATPQLLDALRPAGPRR